MKRNQEKRKGQALILTTLALGGAILGATAIAGILMLYQIRATTDAVNSAEAIFAADAGVEWAQFNLFCNVTSTANPTSRCLNQSGQQPLPGNPPGTLGDGATLEVVCYDSTNAESVCNDQASTTAAISRGSSLNTRRAFFVNLQGASSVTFP